MYYKSRQHRTTRCRRPCCNKIGERSSRGGGFKSAVSSTFTTAAPQSRAQFDTTLTCHSCGSLPQARRNCYSQCRQVGCETGAHPSIYTQGLHFRWATSRAVSSDARYSVAQVFPRKTRCSRAQSTRDHSLRYSNERHQLDIQMSVTRNGRHECEHEHCPKSELILQDVSLLHALREAITLHSNETDRNDHLWSLDRAAGLLNE